MLPLYSTSLMTVPVKAAAPDPAGQTLVIEALPMNWMVDATIWTQLVLIPAVPLKSSSSEGK